MKNYLILVCLFVCAVHLSAQQDHRYTQFMYNKLMYNPAYAGARGVPAISAMYRQQWVGFEGAPKSAMISFNSPFLLKRAGLGAMVSNQEVGLWRDFFLSTAYSYDLIAERDLSLRAGLNASLRSLSLDFSQANPRQAGDLSLDNQKVNQYFGNFGLGMYCTIDKQYYVGISVPRLYTNVIGFNTDSLSVTTAREARHFYFTAGGIFPWKDEVKIMPAILVKYVKNAPVDVDLNINFDFKEKFTAGMSYQLGGDGIGSDIDLLVFMQLSKLVGIGASYDFTLSKLRDYNAGSFEVMLQADLRKPKKRKLSNPRFFM